MPDLAYIILSTGDVTNTGDECRLLSAPDEPDRWFPVVVFHELTRQNLTVLTYRRPNEPTTNP